MPSGLASMAWCWPVAGSVHWPPKAKGRSSGMRDAVCAQSGRNRPRPPKSAVHVRGAKARRASRRRAAGPARTSTAASMARTGWPPGRHGPGMEQQVEAGLRGHVLGFDAAPAFIRSVLDGGGLCVFERQAAQRLLQAAAEDGGLPFRRGEARRCAFCVGQQPAAFHGDHQGGAGLRVPVQERLGPERRVVEDLAAHGFSLPSSSEAISCTASTAAIWRVARSSGCRGKHRAP